MENKTAIITGVAGFIGSHLAERLIEKEYDVTGIDNFDPYYSEEIKKSNIEKIREKTDETRSSFDFVRGSINCKEDLKKMRRGPDTLFHLAALPGTRSSIGMEQKYIKTNVEGTAKVIDYFRPDKTVFMSSSSVYGEKKWNNLPVKEDDEKNPENPYARSKLEAEDIVRRKCQDHAILRPFSVFGPRQRPDEVFTSFISDIIEGNKVKVFGDGSQARDFTHVKDVVEGTLKASEKGCGTYNLGKGEPNTVQDVIDFIDERIDDSVDSSYIPEKEGDVSFTHADIERAESELGYTPTKKFDEEIDSTIRWVREVKERGLL